MVRRGGPRLARMAAQHVLTLTRRGRLVRFVRELDRLAPGNPHALNLEWFADELAKHGSHRTAANRLGSRSSDGTPRGPPRFW